jgi:predicted regulator of Ras-like GTPase activity (Roadblock/LC7/MglB family)
MSSADYEGIHYLQNGLTILPEQDKAIDRTLTDLVASIPADFVLLTDSSGQVISFGGDRAQLDLISLGALIAGEQVASQEMARLAGEYQASQMLIREGTKSNFYICEAGPHLVLLVKASSETPLGWARIVIRQAGETLAKVIADSLDQPRSRQEDDDVFDSLDSAVQDLDQLFDGSFDLDE